MPQNTMPPVRVVGQTIKTQKMVKVLAPHRVVWVFAIVIHPMADVFRCLKYCSLIFVYMNAAIALIERLALLSEHGSLWMRW